MSGNENADGLERPSTSHNCPGDESGTVDTLADCVTRLNCVNTRHTWKDGTNRTYRTDNGCAANKVARRNLIEGGLEITGQVEIYEAVGETVHVPDIDSMAALLKDVGECPESVLVLATFEDVEPNTEFRVLSRRRFKRKFNQEAIGWATDEEGRPTISRLKHNMLPSRWFVFDRDAGVPEMPPAMADCDIDEWMERYLYPLHPELRDAGRIVVPSTSTRLGIESRNCHVYMQAIDTVDIETYGVRMMIHAMTKGATTRAPGRHGIQRHSAVNGFGLKANPLWRAGHDAGYLDSTRTHPGRGEIAY